MCLSSQRVLVSFFGKRRDEILARHSSLLDAEEHDFLLEQPYFGHVLAQVVDQLIEHLRRELELHELGADLLADLLGLRIFRPELVERIQELVVRLGDRVEALGRLFRIRTRVDGLLVLVALLVVVVRRFFALERHHLRILGLRDLVGCVRVHEADDDVHQAHLPGLDGLVVPQQKIVGTGIAAERDLDRLEAFLDALRDADLALARQQLDGTHLAHVHAHGIGGAAEFGVEVGERRGRFLDRLFVRRRGGVGQQQRFGIRCFLVDRNAHVIDHVDDVFDLLRIDDLARQVVVDFGIGEVTLFLAARDQQLQLRLALVSDLSRRACWRFFDQSGRLMKGSTV